MLSTERNIRPDSDYYMYTPSSMAQNLFFYPLITGHFYYEPGYCLKRTSFDSFLIMHIRKGSCEINIGGKHYKAGADQVVLLDCYIPHSYYSSVGWEAEWVHIDGPSARGYFEAILAEGSPVITLNDTYRFQKNLHKIYLQFKDKLSVKEALMNNYIVNILTELLVSKEMESSISISTSVIEDTIAYINDHLTDSLSLEELAAQASLSPFYFSRLFKKETGFTPHYYTIMVRVNNAKFLLKTSNASIKDICFTTGFTSESSFCTTFKKVTGLTPSEYREQLGDD